MKNIQNTPKSICFARFSTFMLMRGSLHSDEVHAFGSASSVIGITDEKLSCQITTCNLEAAYKYARNPERTWRILQQTLGCSTSPAFLRSAEVPRIREDKGPK